MGHPVMKSRTHSLMAVDEDKQLEVGLVGSIEVEYVQRSDDSSSSMEILDRIRLLPPQEKLELLRSVSDSLYSDEHSDEEKEESVEVTDSILEQLTSAFLEGCHCGPCAPVYKGVLREPKRGRGQIPDEIDRNVSFSSLEIHEFNMTLGDHPSAVSGPPVALDWDSEAAERVVDLDEYERTRNPRRKRKQMKLSYRDRKGILEKQRGFTTEEVNEAWAEALKIRQQRRETLARGSLMMMWDDFSESSQRKMAKLANAIGLPVN